MLNAQNLIASRKFKEGFTNIKWPIEITNFTEQLHNGDQPAIDITVKVVAHLKQGQKVNLIGRKALAFNQCELLVRLVEDENHVLEFSDILGESNE